MDNAFLMRWMAGDEVGMAGFEHVFTCLHVFFARVGRGSVSPTSSLLPGVSGLGLQSSPDLHNAHARKSAITEVRLATIEMSTAFCVALLQNPVQ